MRPSTVATRFGPAAEHAHAGAASAGRLSRRVLRQMRNHRDVVSISVDADVTPMSVAGVSGAAKQLASWPTVWTQGCVCNSIRR